MIIEERIGEDLVKHRSSDGKAIRQVGGSNYCFSAIDVYPCLFEYEELEEVPVEEVGVEDALDILMGVTV
jgi:hypothetical protein